MAFNTVQDILTALNTQWLKVRQLSVLGDADFNKAIIRRRIDYPDWTPYTPAWTFGIAAGGIGNGSMNGAYMSLGKLCIFNITLVFGSTTSGGEGGWAFSLPIQAKSMPYTGGAEQEVVVKAYTTGGNAPANWCGNGAIGQGGTTVLPFLSVGSTNCNTGQVQNTDSSGAVGHGIPNTGASYPFVTGAFLVIQGSYWSV